MEERWWRVRVWRGGGEGDVDVRMRRGKRRVRMGVRCMVGVVVVVGG